MGLIKPLISFSNSSSSAVVVPNVAANWNGASIGASIGLILIKPSLDIWISLNAGNIIGCKSSPKTRLPSPFTSCPWTSTLKSPLLDNATSPSLGWIIK